MPIVVDFYLVKKGGNFLAQNNIIIIKKKSPV